MTVIDTSGVVDFLLGTGASGRVEELMVQGGGLAAPDLLVLETVAVLRRETLAGAIEEQRAAAAVDDLGDLPIELFPSLPLRSRAWELRRDLTTADALFVALAEQLQEPLATKDVGLLRAASEQTAIATLGL